MSEAAKASTASKKSGKKVLILGIAAVLLIGGGVAGWFSGVLPRMLGKSGSAQIEASSRGEPGHDEAKAEIGKPVFMDLPDIVANLNSGSRRAAFVKLHAKLELARPEDQAIVQAAIPRVLDLFQGYLREMRPEELRGTAGTYRLREELLARTNLVAPPAKVVAVLFTEMLVQ